MFLLKILNPFIWLWNDFCYFAHLQFYAEMAHAAREKGRHVEYEPYDYSKDVKYF